MSLNRVEVLGRLGADPELKKTPQGQSVLVLSIATSEKWKDKDTGEKKERAEWIRCVFWNKTAEVVAQYLKKGNQIWLEGKMQTRSWEDAKDNITRYSTEVIVSRVELIGSGDNLGKRPPEPPLPAKNDPSAAFEDNSQFACMNGPTSLPSAPQYAADDLPF